MELAPAPSHAWPVRGARWRAPERRWLPLPALAALTHRPRLSGRPGRRCRRASESLATLKTLASQDVNAAEALLEKMLLQQLQPSAAHFVAAVNMFARSGCAQQSDSWFQRMSQHVSPDLFAYSAVINAHARAGDVERAEARFEELRKARLEPDAVCFSSVLNAAAQRGDRKRAEGWLRDMAQARVAANEVTFGSLINACAQGGDAEGAEGYFEKMQSERLRPNGVIYCSLVKANRLRPEAAETWLQRLRQSGLQVPVAAFNSAINACAESGDMDRAERLHGQLQQSKVRPTLVTYNSLIKACASDMTRAEQWLDRMQLSKLAPDEVTFNSLLRGCAQRGDVKSCEAWLRRMERSGVSPDAVTYNTLRAACSRMGDFEGAERWLQAMEASERRAVRQKLSLEEADPFLKSGGVLKKALYRFRSQGDAAIAEHLELALEYQWVYGYPRLPPEESQLTHGAFKYMAGMQAMTARELLKVTSGDVLDPFCGSGTVLIEAAVAGRRAHGCDASPLAAFVARRHTDRATPLGPLVAKAEEISAKLGQSSGDWDILRGEISKAETLLKDCLWFIFAIAWRVVAASRSSDAQPRRYFLSTAYRFAEQLRQLRVASGEAEATVQRCDCRRLCLDEPVGAVITSPPYPGVYSYQLAAQADCQQLGEDSAFGLLLGDFQVEQEIGSASFTPRSEEEAAAMWQEEQVEWLGAAFRNLRPHGTATIMTGDGDRIDSLHSTLLAAAEVGFEVVATSTIESCADEAHQVPGMVRTEHMIHLMKPQ
ncbi:unnamed protein product [Effrenium voratum]|uniref:site-specific DNA-methyltransferase (cytosine-N(4)-specific) n=1 Tax=Effrenium voratum TaxID=2562239 RepID=A0AA36J8L6_9DINO|nr:unnamed protein product [Effrenium voratum]CAJ1427615.1 unnamed protein product [Effrenium voratum]